MTMKGGEMPAWVKAMCSRLGRDPCDVMPADKAAPLLVGPSARMLFPAPQGQPLAVDFACPFAGDHEDGRLVLLWAALPDGPATAALRDVPEAAKAYGDDMANMGVGLTRGGRVHGVLMIPMAYQDSHSRTRALRHVHGYLATEGNQAWDKSKGMTWMLRAPMPLSGPDALKIASGGAQLVAAKEDTMGVRGAVPLSALDSWKQEEWESKTVIVFCAGPTCPLAWREASRLADRGFMRVYVVPEGAPALGGARQDVQGQTQRGGQKFTNILHTLKRGFGFEQQEQ